MEQDEKSRITESLERGLDRAKRDVRIFQSQAAEMEAQLSRLKSASAPSSDQVESNNLLSQPVEGKSTNRPLSRLFAWLSKIKNSAFKVTKSEQVANPEGNTAAVDKSDVRTITSSDIKNVPGITPSYKGPGRRYGGSIKIA